MLSDEEKQAIEGLKGSQKWIRQQIRLGNLPNYNQGHYADIQIALNLIEKQSKEIEDYIENKELINQTLGLEKDSDINKTLEKIIILNNYEDKIKAKIEEWQKEKEFYNKDEDREWGQYNNWDWVDTIINEMQSLLNKE